VNVVTDNPIVEPPVVLLADDLTGALDCAVPFVHGGFGPYVSVAGAVIAPPKTGVVSINADTRRLDPVSVIDLIQESLHAIDRFGGSLRYVKIDSTLRGHPGLEIGICAKFAESPLVLVAPSFPAAGRVVRDGELLVHGVPLAETEVGEYPLSPTATSNVAEILSRDSGLPLHQISLATVRSEQLVVELSRLMKSVDAGPVLVTSDADTDSDLDALASAGLELESRTSGNSFPDRSGVLFAGSAGLAAAIARAIQFRSSQNVKNSAPAADPPLLIVTASQRSLVDRQIAAVIDSRLAELHSIEFQLHPKNGLVSTNFEIGSVTSALTSRRSVALRATVSGDLSSLSAAAVRKAADSLLQQLGQIVANLTSQHAIGGVVLIGGDTASAILSTTDTRGIFLTAEPLPGVPVGTVSGGDFDGITIATKAGAFGDDQTLVRLLKYLATPRATKQP
jgi:uncharacterized protein YgbK (DUF1537 family)